MPAMLILAVAGMGLVLVVLALVIAGIRQEPPAQELTSQAPRLIATLARRLTGVHVLRPDPSAIAGKQHGEPSPSTRSRIRPDGHAR
jgi:hypothetical protein